MVYVVNALSQSDTLANRDSTPALDHTFFTATDTDQTFVGVNGAWRQIGRVGGTSFGAIEFTEISNPAAPAANNARLYIRDNGSNKSQLCWILPSGTIRVLDTEP